MERGEVTLTELTGGLAVDAGGAEAEVVGITCDSRQVRPGFLFAAVKGDGGDGGEFIDDAVSRGASAVLIEEGEAKTEEIKGFDAAVVTTADMRGAVAALSARFFGDPSKRFRHLVGVTGTNGKTTVAYLIESIVAAAGRSPGVIGTVNYRYGDVVSPALLTTPDAPHLQETLRAMADSGVTDVVMEVSSHALAQKRADHSAFTVKVFTNLTSEHLDYHHTMEEYFEAKARLFTDAAFGDGTAIINVDDEWGREIYDRLGGAAVKYSLVGNGREADIFPEVFSFTDDGIVATLRTPAGELPISSALVGEYNLYNIMAAVAAAISMGIEKEAIIEGVGALRSVPGRLEQVGPESSAVKAYVDYAHTPDALDRALGALKSVSAGRIITVFGCGGDRDTSKRPLMGRAVLRLSDLTVITSDNPRDEEPEAIIKDITDGLGDYEEFDAAEEEPSRGYTVVADRLKAIKKAVQMARPGDTVLVAGKGHEDYQIIKGERRHFDDREVLGGLMGDGGEQGGGRGEPGERNERGSVT